MAWPTSGFPTSLDTITDKASGDDVVADDINGAYDCIEHIQVKIGVDSSAVATSLDYLLKNASSSNPGHKHTLAQGATDVTATAAEINAVCDADSAAITVARGGTGAATLTDHGILLGSGTSAITPLGSATNGQLPIGSTGADPVLATLTAGQGITITNGAGSITIAGLIAQAVCNETIFDEVSTGDTGYVTLKTVYVWIPVGATYLRWSGQIHIASGGQTATGKFVIGATSSPEISSTSTSYEFKSSASGMDVSALAGTLATVNIQMKTSQNSNYAYINSAIFYCHTS